MEEGYNSAVEWFIAQIEEKGNASENVSVRRLEISIDVSEYLLLKRIAKIKEEYDKKQISNRTYIDLKMVNNNSRCSIEYLTNLANTLEEAEQYYNTTFKSE